MLQRKRCVPFRRATYVGGGIKMRPSNELRLLTCVRSRFNLGKGEEAEEIFQFMRFWDKAGYR